MEIREATHEDRHQIRPFFRDIVDDGETSAYPGGPVGLRVMYRRLP